MEFYLYILIVIALNFFAWTLLDSMRKAFAMGDPIILWATSGVLLIHLAGVFVISRSEMFSAEKAPLLVGYALLVAGCWWFAMKTQGSAADYIILTALPFAIVIPRLVDWFAINRRANPKPESHD